MESDGPEIGQQENNIDESFSGNRILADVIKSGLYRRADAEGNLLAGSEERIKDINALRKIVEAQRSKVAVDYSADRELPEESELNNRARDLLTEGVDRLIREEIITDYMVKLCTKWFDTKDLSVVKNGRAGQHVVPEDDTEFPSGEERPRIIIPERLISNKMNHYEDIARKAGILISEDDLLDLALESIALHEWSHALERAISIKGLQGMRQLPGFDGERDDYDAHFARYDLVFANAPEKPIIMPTTEGIERDAFSERFASGFEFTDTLIALRNKGIGEEDAKKFIDIILAQKHAHLREFNGIRNASGFGDLEFEIMCFDINEVARKNNIQSNVIMPWAGLGYYSPYQGDELREMLSDSAKTLNDPERLQGMIDKRQNPIA